MTQKYILGVDPGLANTGWAVICHNGSSFRFIASGTIKTKPNDAVDFRLKAIGDGLSEVFQSFSIDECAIEETFVNKNNLSSLKLGQARGAIILTIANHNKSLGEYSATHIKKAIVGTGRASKEQIEAMVKMLISNTKTKNDHEADAVAIAIAHANNSNYNSKLRNAI